MERNDRFERALNSLPPKHRGVLALREVQGLSYDEIAETLEISIGTVKSRIARGREELRRRLKDLI